MKLLLKRGDFLKVRIRDLYGIGEKKAEYFEKKGIYTTKDLLRFFPRDYEDRTKIYDISELKEGDEVCVRARVISTVKETRIRKNMTIYTMKVADESGAMSIIWYNNRFVKNQFKTDDEYIFFGKISRNRGMWEMANPIYERLKNQRYTGKIMPIYPLSNGITQKAIQAATEQALLHCEKEEEFLPYALRMENELAEINFSFKNIHYPADFNALGTAHKRFAFEELYLLSLALMKRKDDTKVVKKIPFSDLECRRELIEKLPFALTNAQERVIEEICADFSRGKLMTRLVQGDVGSGKTAVAAVAMYIAVKNGFQVCLMAPTEILAHQHFETFLEFFKDLGVKIELLCSSTKNKKEVYKKITTGEAEVVIGTHAVIQKDVIFKNLGLVVADEQHRFGVAQRAALASKGDNPHFLVMSATPIPRTLALILYGDLDISILDELPPGRKMVKTYAVGEKMRERVEAFIEKNVSAGSQCYVVCPLIEETEKSDLNNAKDICEHFKTLFPQFTTGLIHGRMKTKEKDEIMEKFVAKKIDILVSTTVIEVGVNVPSSNIMIIENAERFGLSQLHQLRGRVGRGAEQAYCILFSDGGSEITKKRLKTMCSSNDGFYISEQDLKLRGPGDFFGTRQHGLPELKAANLFEDMEILKKAQQAAIKTISGELEFGLGEEEVLFKRVSQILSEENIIN